MTGTDDMPPRYENGMSPGSFDFILSSVLRTLVIGSYPALTYYFGLTASWL